MTLHLTWLGSEKKTARPVSAAVIWVAENARTASIRLQLLLRARCSFQCFVGNCEVEDFFVSPVEGGSGTSIQDDFEMRASSCCFNQTKQV